MNEKWTVVILKWRPDGLFRDLNVLRNIFTKRQVWVSPVCPWEAARKCLFGCRSVFSGQGCNPGKQHDLSRPKNAPVDAYHDGGIRFLMLPRNLFGWRLWWRLVTQRVWLDQFQYTCLVQNAAFPAWMETIWWKICDRGCFFMLLSVEKPPRLTPDTVIPRHRQSKILGPDGSP